MDVKVRIHPHPARPLRPRTSTAAFVLVARIVVACLVATGLSAVHAGTDIYQYAGECVALRDNVSSRYVVRYPFGYSTTPRADLATPFRMQATDLGSYLLYGPDTAMPVAGFFNLVVPSGRASRSADWVLTDEPAGLRLTSVATGLDLGVGWLGGLIQSFFPNARWSFEPAGGCATFPELQVGVVGDPLPGPTPDAEVRGFVDAHVHPTAFEFMGGSIHCGRPWSPYGVQEAMRDCPDHGLNGAFALVENLLSSGELVALHTNDGYPNFGSPLLPGWPRHDSLTHEGTYWKGIERAWRSGLRVMVAHLVENRALCEIYWLGDNPCTDMASIRLQAEQLYALQDYIDAQFKGPGKGFFRIVTTPAEARAVINEGKLAVVIGVETSQPFDCLYQNGVEICSEEQIDAGLQEMWDMGVRSLFPVHKFDNAFGGTAMDEGTTGIIVNLGNLYMTGNWWETGPCPPGFEPDETPGSLAQGVPEEILALATAPPDERVFREDFTSPLLGEDLPDYGVEEPVCNVRGLTELGEYLINRMMDMGMIIETDHLSSIARDRALEIIEARGYSGVITSHSWGGPVSTPRIQALGGIVAVRANTTNTFIAEWEAVRATQSGEHLWGVAYGTDTNGIAVQASPRPGASENSPVTYPFSSFDGSATIQQSQWANRAWDFNVDGAAHYGLFADWVEDMGNVRGGDIVEELGLAAEAYLQMWERAVAGGD